MLVLGMLVIDHFLGLVTAFQVQIETSSVQDQSCERNQEEFYLEFYGENFEQEGEFGFDDGAEEEEFYEADEFLLFLFASGFWKIKHNTNRWVKEETKREINKLAKYLFWSAG